jgi:hypothetical protein
MAVLLGAIKKPFNEYIKPHLNKYEKKTNLVFNDFQKERRLKNLKTLTEINRLWNSKYLKKMEKLDKESLEEYRKLYYKFHNIK